MTVLRTGIVAALLLVATAMLATERFDMSASKFVYPANGDFVLAFDSDPTTP